MGWRRSVANGRAVGRQPQSARLRVAERSVVVVGRSQTSAARPTALSPQPRDPRLAARSRLGCHRTAGRRTSGQACRNGARSRAGP